MLYLSEQAEDGTRVPPAPVHHSIFLECDRAITINDQFAMALHIVLTQETR
jgi:hypothetical protein